MIWITTNVRQMGWHLKERIDEFHKKGRNDTFEDLFMEFKGSGDYSRAERRGNRMMLIAEEIPFHFEISKNHVTGGLGDIETVGSGPYWGLYASQSVERDMSTVCLRARPTLKARQMKTFFTKELNYTDIGKI